MHKQAKIYVAGHDGLVGTALMQQLYAAGYTHIITRSRADLDLRNQAAVNKFFDKERPEYVFLLAAKVGGIYANSTFPAEFIYDNLMIEANVIHAAHQFGVSKLLFLGSSCIYPRDCAQPMKPEHLLTGPLEQTNASYAVAKIAGISLCQSYNRQYGTNFISCMPTNLYGPHDNFDFMHAHVIPALIAKIVAAHERFDERVTVWGTGMPRREFLYVDDMVQALIFLMRNYDQHEIINIGVGHDVSIFELAHLIKELVCYKGELVFDATRPDGTPHKLLDVTKIHALGWRAKTSLCEGLSHTIAWYKRTKLSHTTARGLHHEQIGA